MKVYAPKKYKRGADKWFTEIFRVHSLEEYAEFFARGFKKEEGTHRIYPWFYSRVFLLCLVLFGAFAFVTTATAEVMTYIGLPTVILTGAILINIPVMVLLYEVYPGKDFSFFSLCVITFICSAVSDILINFGYFLFIPENKWLSTLWTAFVEETGKAIPMLVALFFLKKRDPLQCLIIGASAGIGMAIYEDMGYIFFSSIAGFADMSSAVFVTIIRALTSFFGHVIWTGFIGWAFAKFSRPLINIKFWGMYVLSMALHYLWDFPYILVMLLTILVSLLVGIIVFVRIIKRERYNIFYPKILPQPIVAVAETPPAAEQITAIAETSPVLTETIAEEAVEESAVSATESASADSADNVVTDVPFADFDLKTPVEEKSDAVAMQTAEPVFNRAGIAMAITSILLSILAMAYCIFGVNGGVGTYYFVTAEDFQSAVQYGLKLNTNTGREYDFYSENYSVYFVEGNIEQVVQKVDYNGRDYYYTYSVVGRYYAFENLKVDVEGVIYTLEALYNGSEWIYYYNLIPDVQTCYYDADNEQYVVQTFTDYSFNKSADMIIGIIAGVVLALGGAVAISYAVSQKKKRIEQ